MAGDGSASPADEAPPSPSRDGRVEPEHLVVGHISKPHGTKGEVFVWPLTDRPDGVFVEGRELILGDEEAQIGAELNTLKIERTRS